MEREAIAARAPLLGGKAEPGDGAARRRDELIAVRLAAIALGGFTGPEADTLGYAIRKKKSSVLRAQKERFVSQAAERGVGGEVIAFVW